jgi:ATP/maltotriose-dependent transcriptional regulator MalT
VVKPRRDDPAREPTFVHPRSLVLGLILISEYFRDEILSATPPGLLEFMVDSSVLEELSGPLCDAVLQRRGSGVALARLAQINLFLRPVDHAHRQYRRHRLLRESLEGELWRTDPELACELHLRASAWLDQRGEVDRAINHAVAANDAHRVGELLWPNVSHYVTHGRGAQVQSWLSAFSHHRISDCPPLALSAAHASLAMGDAVQARRWRLAATAALDCDAPAPNRRSLTAGAALIDAMSAGRGHRYARGRRARLSAGTGGKPVAATGVPAQRHRASPGRRSRGCEARAGGGRGPRCGGRAKCHIAVPGRVRGHRARGQGLGYRRRAQRLGRTLLAEASRLARRTPEAVTFGPWFDEAWEHLDTLAENSMAGPSSLTIAELRILRFLPSHRSFREIAVQLGVSANTVETQAHAVYRKLGAASRSEAVARATEAGLLGR